VSQNAQRLAKIVDDILEAARAQPQDSGLSPLQIALDETVSRICRDWSSQNQCPQRLCWQLGAPALSVPFEGDHLRRVLVNLLDNARRFSLDSSGGIQVQTRERPATLSVWSEGPAMDQTVERHLFEPFFSSESRSSGLGLYICRQLCEGHGAGMAYQRNTREVAGRQVHGNEFSVSFAQAASAQPDDPKQSRWPITSS